MASDSGVVVTGGTLRRTVRRFNHLVLRGRSIERLEARFCGQVERGERQQRSRLKRRLTP